MSRRSVRSHTQPIQLSQESQFPPRSQSASRSQPTQRLQSSQQSTQSQGSSQSHENIPDFDRMVAEVVQYFLVMEQKRFPVKRADITKLLNLKGVATAKAFKAVMAQAGQYLNDIFGYSLHEFDERAGHYVLLNQVIMPESLCQQDLQVNNTILFLTLSAIYLSEGQIIEDEIWNMLDILGYRPEEHKKLITQDFVRQLYINAELMPQSDPPKFNFLWGERATIEFTKLEILDFASKIYGQPPEQFGSLWKTAEKESKEAAES